MVEMYCVAIDTREEVAGWHEVVEEGRRTNKKMKRDARIYRKGRERKRAPQKISPDHVLLLIKHFHSALPKFRLVPTVGRTSLPTLQRLCNSTLPPQRRTGIAVFLAMTTSTLDTSLGFFSIDRHGARSRLWSPVGLGLQRSPALLKHIWTLFLLYRRLTRKLRNTDHGGTKLSKASAVPG
jgi:hypothetical protein